MRIHKDGRVSDKVTFLKYNLSTVVGQHQIRKTGFLEDNDDDGIQYREIVGRLGRGDTEEVTTDRENVIVAAIDIRGL